MTKFTFVQTSQTRQLTTYICYDGDKHASPPMFVERKVGYSALFTYLVGRHAGAVSFHPSDIILAHLE
jgi:hypothetical protein